MKRNPTQHNMERRSREHDYTRSGVYHITLKAAAGAPFGTLEGTADTPRMALSPVGRMVEEELLHSIPAHYPMVTIDTHVVMPDHLHVLAVVTAPLVNNAGGSTHLGQVIKGFKYGCNRGYWQLLGLPTGHRATESPGTLCQPNRSAGAYPSLFAEGYCDVMPVDREQLETQRAYIRDNPRSRLLRTAQRDRLAARRGAVATALTVNALLGYLRRECGPAQAPPEALEAVAGRLLTRPGSRPAEPAGTLCPPSSPAGLEVVCDSYGDGGLLERRLLPVVCHRRDKSRFAEQKRRCLDEAARGAVLISARIAKGEQEIIDAAVAAGHPVALVADNGFPDRYHPSATQLDRCAAGRLLLVTPWRYRYRPKEEAITVVECKTMNCVVQALCRRDDRWWKETPTPATGARQIVEHRQLGDNIGTKTHKEK